jgi:hypothetical protein
VELFGGAIPISTCKVNLWRLELGSNIGDDADGYLADDMSRQQNDVQKLLDQQIALLRASSFELLFERFTELERGRFSRRTRRVGRAEEILELRADSGRTYDAELWAVPEDEDRLHVFVEVMGEDANAQWTEASTDFLIPRVPWKREGV